MRSDDILRLVEGAYAAALDDSLWEPWATETVFKLGGNGGALSVIDVNDGSLRKLVPLGWERAEAEYRAHWCQYDPLIPAVMRANRTITFRDTDHVDLSDPETQRYMAWQRSEVDFDHHLGAAVPLNASLRAGISIHRASTDGYVSQDKFDALQQIFSQASRAMRLGFLHAEMLDDRFWAGLTTHNNAAALLLNEAGMVIRLNESAEAILASHDGLLANRGKLECLFPSDGTNLARAISGAVNRNGSSTAVSIRRKSRRPPLIFIIYPLAWTRRSIAPLEAAALVRLIDPCSYHARSGSLFATAFNLTRRETDLALLLIGNHSVESAANVMEVALPTARVHLRHILTKTGTSRQSELLQLLANFQ